MLDLLSDAPRLIYEQIRFWIEAGIKASPKFVVSILVLVIAHYLSRILARTFYRLLSRLFDNETLLRVFMTIFSNLVFFTGVALALSILDWDGPVKTFLTGAGIIGLALSFAFQDLATNFISGVIIAVQKPLSLGDLVETNGYLGEVTHIGLRSITIRTLDEQHVVIPSKEIFQNPLKNYMHSEQRRARLVVGVSYSSDLEFVQKITHQAVESVSEIDQSNPVKIFFFEFGDSSINFELFFWLHRSSQMHYLSVMSKVVIAIKKAYDANGINIPFPIRTLDMSLTQNDPLHTLKPQS